MKNKLMIAHGKTMHPYSKRKKCKVCQKVEKEFLKVFGKDPKNWPALICADSKKILNNIKKRIEKKYEI